MKNCFLLIKYELNILLMFTFVHYYTILSNSFTIVSREKVAFIICFFKDI